MSKHHCPGTQKPCQNEGDECPTAGTCERHIADGWEYVEHPDVPEHVLRFLRPLENPGRFEQPMPAEPAELVPFDAAAAPVPEDITYHVRIWVRDLWPYIRRDVLRYRIFYRRRD